jgi:hypothetical protein
MWKAIRSIGPSAAATLRACSELEIVAVFERSLYLRHGDSFVCLGATSVGDGPLNVLIESGEPFLARRPIGEVVRSAEHRISFRGDETLCWADAGLWSMPSWPLASRWSTLTAATLNMLLAASPGDGLFRHAVHPYPRTARPAITSLHVRAEAALVALSVGLVAEPTQRVDRLKAATQDLIGFGPGLTPSGDDVLAGVLIGLHASGRTFLAAELGALVTAASVDGTSALSAAFLRCAIDGETSADLHRVCSAALTNTDWPSALDTLNRIGHTSGWDHLAGVLLAITTVQPRPHP